MKFHYPLVEVCWIDAETSYGWEDIAEADLSPAFAITVGFLVAQNEHYIMIASTYSENTCNSRIKIPKTMIEGMKELKAAASKKSLLRNPQPIKPRPHQPEVLKEEILELPSTDPQNSSQTK